MKMEQTECSETLA